MTLQSSLQQGITFLQTAQLDNGNWHIGVSKTPDMHEPEQRDNVFSAAVIVREIAAMITGTEMLARACAFLRAQQRTGGLWNFYRKGDLRLFPNDFDTTSCSAAALLLAQQPLDLAPILNQLDQYRHPEGSYWTFTMPPAPMGANPVASNFRDHAVEVHILIFLTLADAGADAESLIQYLVEVLRSRDYLTPQTCYDSPLLFLSMFARGLAYLAHPARELQAEITEHLLEQANSHPLNSLEVAWLIRGLLACGYEGAMEWWVQQLLARQADDGGWPSEYMYYTAIHYYGGRSITTAMALNALAAYLKTRSRV